MAASHSCSASFRASWEYTFDPSGPSLPSSKTADAGRFVPISLALVAMWRAAIAPRTNCCWNAISAASSCLRRRWAAARPLLFMKFSIGGRPSGKGNASPSIKCSKNGISNRSICRTSALNIGQLSGFSLAKTKIRLSCSSLRPWATALRKAAGSSIWR